MTKTWEDYYNDPDIIHEHPILREIHAIRFMHNDERKALGEAEYNARMTERTNAFLAGLPAPPSAEHEDTQ